MVKRYVAKDFVVILDDVIDDDQVGVYAKELSDVHAFLLLPRLEIIQQRDEGRVPEKRMRERVGVLYNELAGKEYKITQKVNSSDQTPEETASLIYSKIAARK